MRLPRFKKWFAGLPALNQPQRRQVLEALRPAAGLDQLLVLLDKFRTDRCCPACASTHWHRHGQANGLQRYRCRDCRRSFNDLSGTQLARLRKREKWIDYLDALLESLSVRRAAQRVEVHRNTAFRWRHRILSMVKEARPQRGSRPPRPCCASPSNPSIAKGDSVHGRPRFASTSVAKGK